jgi:hypothetical protein
VNDRHLSLLADKLYSPIRKAAPKGNDGSLDSSTASYHDENDPEDNGVERIIRAWLGLGTVSESTSFLIKSGIFLLICATTLFVALGASYPAVHDTLHNVRHALAVVPCH